MPMKIAPGPFTVLLFGLLVAGAGFAEEPDHPSKQAPEASSSIGDVTSPSGTAAGPHVGGPGGSPGTDTPNLKTPNGGADNSGRVDTKDAGAENPSRINTTKDTVDERPDTSLDNHRGSLQAVPPGASVHSGEAKETPWTAKPIDTSITVQPHRTAKNASKHHDSLKKPHPTSPSAIWAEHHQKSATGRRGREMRNAIGVSVPPDQSATQPADAAHGTSPVIPPSGAATATGSTIGTGVNELAKLPHEPGLSNPGTQKIGHPIATSPMAHPATGINGTGMVRPGRGPGVVGGAAKNMASINGTTIRPKH